MSIKGKVRIFSPTGHRGWNFVKVCSWSEQSCSGPYFLI